MNYREKFVDQLNHRTIREFKEEALDQDLVTSLLEVANRTATSMGAQSYSIIRVKDQEKRKKIAQVCKQEYVARAPELWIFLVDGYRNSQIARQQGVELEAEKTMDIFFQGFTDASLAAQNVVNASESLGLGTVYFGSILNDSQAIIDILQLPQLTFPVVGLGIGHPNQEPQLKPRMPLDLKVFEDEYKLLDDYLGAIKDYDQEMQTYYDLRDKNKRVDSFSKQVVKRFENPIRLREEMMNVIVKQGFDLRLK